VAVGTSSADGRRDGPPDSGVRGRPKRIAVRRAPRNCRGRRRAELSLRVGADGPWNWLGNTVWRIKRRPVWNMSGGIGRLSVAEGFFAAPERPPEISSGPLRVRLWPCRRSKPSLMRECQGSDAARAREPSLLLAARVALALERRENAEIVPKRRFRRCTGRLNATQPGVNGRQHPRTYVDCACGAS
jgi:hypothetical protein